MRNLNFEQEKACIDGIYTAFVNVVQECGLSVEGEAYLCSTKRGKKIKFLLTIKPLAPRVQQEIIDTDNRVVMGMFAKRYNLNPDPERHLKKATSGMRKVYFSKQRFRDELEIDFSKSARIRELQSYISFHGANMCKKAVNICRDARYMKV